MTLAFEINAPIVSGEVIDGEAIVMHLGSGHYFSSTGSGALIWQGIEQRAAAESIIDVIVASYGIAHADAAAAVETFTATLSRHDLIRPAAEPTPDFAPAAVDVPGWAEPELAVHTDMQDLLLLDPIHDVVDEMGWPAPLRA